MSDDERFQAWLDKVCARPLPQNPMARIRTLAKELAEGATEGLWDIEIEVNEWERFFQHKDIMSLLDDEISLANSKFDETHLNVKFSRMVRRVIQYISYKWSSDAPPLNLLAANQYLSVPVDYPQKFQIVKAAFDLIEETEPPNIFISYKRSESSALALLILKCLKAEGLEAFLDLALEAGEDWHAGLKERIQQYDYLVLLVGKETLKSDVVIKEIQWALEAGLSLIPIWHGGFKYQSGEWTLPPEIEQKLANTHAIEVKEESALGYDTAITELLNRFGITP